ncbi:hypothetical protein DNTS_023914 [Danionella cerebrum]|uniref:Uncharacterized protein n=1 Tax=Danionella cerebrum TaxID=2873325 RepID=A0A553MV21_9TELE|nr:hypothetical protein DNTS_023914 [Danionella translucida]
MSHHEKAISQAAQAVQGSSPQFNFTHPRGESRQGSVSLKGQREKTEQETAPQTTKPTDITKMPCYEDWRGKGVVVEKHLLEEQESEGSSMYRMRNDALE